MPHVSSYLLDLVLASFVIWEVKKDFRVYPGFKQAVARGEPDARRRFYFRILRFEWISALLALAALGFERAKLRASALRLDNTAFGRWVSEAKAAGTGVIVGFAVGLLIGLLVLSIVRLRARGRPPAPTENSAKPWWRKLIPDFDALIPVTRRERMLFALVAVSAGICEELVFRGWLLFSLHSLVGLNGTTLILVAAVLFGACHIYQGITGMIGTAIVGVILSGLYVATGALLAPMVLHCLIDLRASILPASTPQIARPETAR